MFEKRPPAAMRSTAARVNASQARRRVNANASRGYDMNAASVHLSRVDSRFARWIDWIGPLEKTWTADFDPFDALARAILYQQLAGKAAATIVGRVETLLDCQRFTPEAVLAQETDAIRACGVSGNKQLALRDLASKCLEGVVPRADELDAIGDASLIERISAVRGIGRWTVEMMLLFRLGRPDVLAIDDLGVRKGAQILQATPRRRAAARSSDSTESNAEPRRDSNTNAPTPKPRPSSGSAQSMERANRPTVDPRRLASLALPTPRELAVLGEPWGPYRSHACRYLWRIADSARDNPAATPPVRRSQDP